MTLSAEQSLLRRCAGAEAAEAKALRADATGVVDWPLLLDAADYHGLTPLLAVALERAGTDAAPAQIVALLRDAYRLGAKRALFFSTRLRLLLAALRAQGVVAIPLKGPSLAEELYPDPALRPFSDLDLLVRRRDVDAALRALAHEGYALAPHLARLPVETLLSHGCEVSMQSASGVTVDLQWAVGPSDYPFAFDPETLWRNAIGPSPEGGEATSLSLEALLLFLCAHGAKHRWSRLMWLGDLARLQQREIDWERAMQLAQEARCMRPVLLGLLLAHETLGAVTPDAILARARADGVVLRQAQRAGAHLLRLPPMEPSGLALVAFNAALANSLADRAQHFAAQLRAPTEAELQAISLPTKLFALYYPIRFARITAKCLTRALIGPGRKS